MAHGSYDDYGGDNEVRTHARTRVNAFTHCMSTAIYYIDNVKDRGNILIPSIKSRMSPYFKPNSQNMVSINHFNILLTFSLYLYNFFEVNPEWSFLNICVFKLISNIPIFLN